MCLDRIARRTRTRKEYFGYQVFKIPPNYDKRRHKLRSMFMGLSQPKIGVWQVAHNTHMYADNIRSWLRTNHFPQNDYPPGFHCFIKIEGAEDLLARANRDGPAVCIRKVKMRKVHTIGVQRNHEVWVAKERKILPLRKRRRKGIKRV